MQRFSRIRMGSVKLLLLFCAFIVSLKIVVSNNDSQLGDTCTISHLGKSGVCRFFDDCPTITKTWSRQSAYPTLCGIHDNKKVFCCPEDDLTTRAAFDTPEKMRISRKSTYLLSLA